MGDYAIQARFEAACAPGDVMRWLTSPEGIAAWWSDTVSGAAAGVGDRFRLRFPTTDVPFDIVVSESSGHLVEWEIPESPPWWRGTTVGFELDTTDSGGTSLLFTHRGFDSNDPIIAVITPAWVGFVQNLVAVAETGEPNPAVVN